MYRKKMFNHVMLSIWAVPVGTAIVGCLLALMAWWLGGDYRAFIETYFVHFNGFFVGGSAYMLLVFIVTYKGGVIADINLLFGNYCINNRSYYRALKFSQSRYMALMYICSITVVGGASLYINGYPLSGFEKIAIMASTFSIYSVAGYGLWSFVSIYKIVNSLDLCVLDASIIGENRIDKLISYINISSGMALAALFISFNGTLTANFTYELYGESTKYILLLPIILFIPFLLYYNYYPHLMLKRMYEQSINLELNELKKTLSEKYANDKDALALEQMAHRHEIYLNGKLSRLTLPTFGNIAVMATAIYMGVNLLVSVYQLQIPN